MFAAEASFHGARACIERVHVRSTVTESTQRKLPTGLDAATMDVIQHAQQFMRI